MNKSLQTPLYRAKTIKEEVTDGVQMAAGIIAVTWLGYYYDGVTLEWAKNTSWLIVTLPALFFFMAKLVPCSRGKVDIH